LGSRLETAMVRSRTSSCPEAASAAPRRLGPLLRGLLLLTLLAPALLLPSPSRAELRTEQAAQPLAFDLFRWEVGRLVERFDSLPQALSGQRAAVSPTDLEAIRTYFQTPPAGRAGLRVAVEPAIERLVGDAWQSEGLLTPSPLAGGQEIVFPP